MNKPSLKSTITVSLLSAVLFISAIASISMMPEVKAQGPILSLNPPLQEATVSTEFTIDINVTSVTDLFVWQANITFNPALMEFVNAVDGPFLQTGGLSLFAYDDTKTADGIIRLGSTLISGSGVSGSGTLATLTFHCKGAGNSPVEFNTTDTETFLLDSSRQPIPYSSENAVVNQDYPPPPTIYVDSPPSVIVSTEFDIIISIRDIPSEWGLVGFDLEVSWDPNDLEYIGDEFLGDGRPGWIGTCNFIIPGLATGGGTDSRSFPASRWTEDAVWLRFRFHCLQEGPATITVGSLADLTIYLEDSTGTVFPFDPEIVEVTVDQIEPTFVGGISTSANKLEIITPFIILGLVIAVSAIVITKRK
jgi:hypothetical protein